MGRKIPFKNVVRNLKLGRYRGKIIDADYSNLGVRLFNEIKFADNLGTTKQHLRNIGLIKITEQVGWHLPREPTAKELLEFWKKGMIGENMGLSQKRKNTPKQLRLVELPTPTKFGKPRHRRKRKKRRHR